MMTKVNTPHFTFHHFGMLFTKPSTSCLDLKMMNMYVGNELSWWLEEAPQNEAKYWVDDKDYNVSDVDAFYDFLVEFLKKKKTETNNE